MIRIAARRVGTPYLAPCFSELWRCSGPLRVADPAERITAALKLWRNKGCRSVTESTRPKRSFLKKCHNFRLALDDFGTAYCVSAGQPRYYLLLTEVHRLLALLFTTIPI